MDAPQVEVEVEKKKKKKRPFFQNSGASLRNRKLDLLLALDYWNECKATPGADTERAQKLYKCALSSVERKVISMEKRAMKKRQEKNTFLF